MILRRLGLVFAIVVGVIGGVLIIGTITGYLVGGRASSLPAAAVGVERGVPTVHFKLCAPRQIGRLSVEEGDAADGRVVWSARLLSPDSGSSTLAIAASVPGYAVTGGALADDKTYAVTEADDQSGDALNAAYLPFRIRDLRPGSVRMNNGKTEPLRQWLSNGEQCR